MTLGPGTKIGAFLVERELGRGAMGVVFLAVDTSLRRKVAIKVLQPAAAAQADTRARFLREIRALGQLENEHIVKVYAAGELPDGLPYVVMELLPGRSLEKRIEEGPLSIREAVVYALQIAGALSLAHEAGILHRDIKPANLFLAERGRRSPAIKILDFGIAKDLSALDALTATGEIFGSPAYMSPEQIAARQDIDTRTDIWSLGVTLYEMLTGELPFTAGTIGALVMKITTAAAPSIASKRPDVPVALEALVMRCLEKDPSLRPATAADVVRALDAISLAGGPARDARTPASTTFIVALSAVLLAAAAAAAMFVGLGGSKPRESSSVVPPATSAAPISPNAAPSEAELPSSASEVASSAAAPSRVPAPPVAPSAAFVDRPPSSKVAITVTHANVFGGWVAAHHDALAACLPARMPRRAFGVICPPVAGVAVTCGASFKSGGTDPAIDDCVARLVATAGVPCGKDCTSSEIVTFTVR